MKKFGNLSREQVEIVQDILKFIDDQVGQFYDTGDIEDASACKNVVKDIETRYGVKCPSKEKKKERVKK